MSGLSVRGMRKAFGGVVAVDGVDLDVPAGRVSALIGPNGAGKTTLFDCITGRTSADSGSVSVDGRDISSLAVDARARAGLGRTFQRLEVFAGLSVLDNLLVAAEGAATPLAALRSTVRRGGGGAAAEASRQVLDRLGIGHLSGVPAGELPTGTLRLVELARALVARPGVLLLDEPASGLAPSELDRLRSVLCGLAADGLAVLLVEHDVDLVMGASDRVHVMASGRIVASGEPAEVAADPVVREVYLGGVT